MVGTNCFLPEFCAGFGKYLVCFRVEKAPLLREQAGHPEVFFVPLPNSFQDTLYLFVGDQHLLQKAWVRLGNVRFRFLPSPLPPLPTLAL